MVQIFVQLTKEQVKTLKAMAKDRKVSVVELIQESVKQFLTTSSNKASVDKKRKRALAGIQKIKKMKFHDIDGKADLSINHDTYLDEIYAA